MVSNLTLNNRDFEIITLVSRVGFLTETHISALFYGKHKGLTLDLARARSSLSHRIGQLVNAEYLVRSSLPSAGRFNRVAYLLGPAGAETIKNPREIESHLAPRWALRRSNDMLIRSRHDVVGINFLVNLMMLARVLEDFKLVSWIPDRGCRFYMSKGEEKLVVNPDLYLETQNGTSDVPSVFLEVDRETLDKKMLSLKVLRLFQYFASKKYEEDLSTTVFPGLCFLAPSKERLKTIMDVIISTKRYYKGPQARTVTRIPFWLTTFELAEVDSIERGFVTKKPLESIWFSDDGERCPSPLLP